MVHAYCVLDTKVIAIPLQQWLQERTSILRYTYIARLGEYFILFYFIDYIKFSERANKINENPCFDSQAFLTYYELL